MIAAVTSYLHSLWPLRQIRRHIDKPSQSLVSRRQGLISTVFAAFLSTHTYAQAPAESPAMTSDRCAQGAALLVSQESANTNDSDTSAVLWQAPNQAWQAAHVGQVFCYGDSLRIVSNRAALKLANDTLVRLDKGTVVRFVEPQKSFWLELIEGVAHFISRTPKAFTVTVPEPYVNASIDGTEFVLSYRDQQTTLAVFEGAVNFSNSQGNAQLTSGQQSIIANNQAPSPITQIQLQNSIDWALHYPPLFLTAKPTLSDTIRQAITQGLATGNYDPALTQLRQEATSDTSGDLLALLAATALYGGQVDDANQAIEQSLEMNPKHPMAKALGALIQLTQGLRETALENTRQLRQRHPNHAAVLLASSYTLQADFELKDALQAVEEALVLAPKEPILLARQAELALSLGQTAKAQRAVDSALAISPRFFRARTLKGLIALNRNRIREANILLSDAVTQHSADPLAHFALGLSDIRLGDLQKGRGHIEIAVALDPGNSLYRSYLGKAYYEENRNTLAGEQYRLAKELDPEDPTPWFYSALSKQADNRLIEAIDELDTAIALNDNRAVYRSRFALDKDNAARSASQGRLYQALGFEQLAINAGTDAITQAPAEHSGHRLLAETYANDTRFESLRASERLQATLLQPLGAQPLSVGLSETGLLVVEGAGPSDIGLNEYNPLFLQKGITVRNTFVTGANNTKAADWSISGLGERAAFSLGQYLYETDGITANNDADYEITNLLLQFQPTEHFGFQIEQRHRSDDLGDLTIDFNFSDFSENTRLREVSDTSRIGFNYKPSTNSIVLGSASYKEVATNEFQEQAPGATQLDVNDSKSHALDLQYQLNNKQSKWIIGLASSEANDKTTRTVSFGPPTFPFTFTNSATSNFEDRHLDFYTYNYRSFFDNTIEITIGGSYHDYDLSREESTAVTQGLSTNEFNHKLGATWHLSPQLTLKAASFETLSRLNSIPSSLEPTHINGFAQIYDETRGYSSKVHGLSLDYKSNSNLKAGVAFNKRKIDILDYLDGGSGGLLSIPNNRIDYINTYLSLPINRGVVVSAKYSLEQYKRELSDLRNTSRPAKFDTHILPLAVNYSFNSRISNQLTATWVKQEISSELTGSRLEKVKEQFWSLDASMIFLFNNEGSLSIHITNLLDKEHKYRDPTVFDITPRSQRFIPERAVFIKGSIAF